ncbi:AbiTii domain-containing protein [Kocuria sp. KH4]
MKNTLLSSLRERVLDESEPLAGLLRKCLLLGAETGSESLRQWARYELNGYGADVDVPNYRLLPTLPIQVNSISGMTVVTGQTFNRLQLPVEAREGVPESFPLRQPVEELESLTGRSSVSFTDTGLAYAQTVWNSQLGPYQQITGMSYSLAGAVLTGVLGQIRTQLVDVVADLTAETPLAELPRKDAVDAAVGQHIGTQYNTTIQTATGPTAVGSGAKAKSEGLSVEGAIKLLIAVQDAAKDVPDGESRAELLAAVEDLRTATEQEAPDTGEVIKKAGKLRTLAERIGVPAVTAATSGAVETVTTLALSGAFG